MLPRRPALIYRPTRAKVKPGDFAQTLGEARTIYGVFVIHEATTGFIVHRYTDAVPEDIVVIDSAQYRIKQVIRTTTAHEKELALERVDKPIFPVSEATSGS